jgi:hypothetical protein
MLIISSAKSEIYVL